MVCRKKQSDIINIQKVPVLRIVDNFTITARYITLTKHDTIKHNKGAINAVGILTGNAYHEVN